MYAAQPQPIPAPVTFRLIGLLDAELISSFIVMEKGLVGIDGSTVLVDVRDLQVQHLGDMTALADAVQSARAEGRDVRLDARTLPWQRLIKKNLSAQPVVNAQLRSSSRRTVILAHSPKKSKRAR